MQVRVDQRAERLGALEPGVEIEPQLAGEREVRPLPVATTMRSTGPSSRMPSAVSPSTDHLAARRPHRRRGEAGTSVTRPVDEVLHVRAELAARRQLIGAPPP